MKILIADKLPPEAGQRLAQGGFKVVQDPSLCDDALKDALAREDPDVLVVRSTRVRAEHLSAGARLSLVVRAGAGVNTIDVAQAANLGIYVANCPGKNAAAVAELAFGLILAADRQIPNVARDMRQGQWRKKHYSAAQGLHGRTLGLLGLGNAGQAMIPRAQAFGMKVVAWSRSLTPARAQALGVTQAADPLEVARHSDVVSVHVALAPETRGLVGRAFLEAMRPGATLINTSRGGVVDEDSLLWAVQHRALRCGVDVWSGEPGGGQASFGSPLLEQEQVYGTCHIAASTAQAQQAVADQAVAIALTWRDTGVVPCCVNLSRRSRATHLLVVRHLDRVGVLAGVLDLLRRDQVNVQEMDNVIFDGGKAAVARIRLDQAPSPGALSQMDQAADILALDLLPLTLGEA